MKKFVALLGCFALAACGKPANIDGKHYDTYGLLNEDSEKSPNVCYEISAENLILSIILIETVIAPVYFLGFSLYNPVKKKVGVDCAD